MMPVRVVVMTMVMLMMMINITARPHRSTAYVHAYGLLLPTE